ncbi:MAG: phage late control D family protein, partial [Cyanobacteriota bacterium]
MALPDIKIRCDGRPLPAELEVLDLEIQLDLNRIPQASLTLLDGNVAERCFEISDGALFKPGSRVSIALGYGGGGPAPVQIFEGIVTRHAVSAGNEGLRLKVNLRDRAITMTRSRHSRVFANKNDAEVMHQLISQANLKVGRLARTPITHPELVQFNVSDWDFILCRSDVLGLAIRVQNG